MPTALVTGPTSGIGLAFARQLAARRTDLILVSRDAERLEEVAAELRGTFNVMVEVLPADLSADLSHVEARLAASDRPVDVLINNAGFTVGKPFVGGDVAAEQRLIDVMVTAVMRLTHVALPGMVERGRGAVVNVGSVAGLVPRGTYSAAKAWVRAFTTGLRPQVAGTGVRIMLLAPGFTRTEFHERAAMSTSSLPRFLWHDADAVVTRALRDLDRGVPVSVPGVVYKAASTVLPRLPLRVLIGAGTVNASRPWQ